MATLTAIKLTKLRNNNYVVKDISLTVNSGEIVGLLGPNGAGKTTTFYILLGIVCCNSGCILIDKKDISILPLYMRARLGISYLPQDASIFRNLSVFKNIMAVLQIRNDLNDHQRCSLAKNLMEELHILHLSNNLGKSLSGGERRRVEIARALSVNPKFILLDEPFAGIDPISVNDIKDIIKYLSKQGLGVLITDHNVRDTLDICKRVYIVNQGKLIAEGSATDILYNEHVKQVYLGKEFNLF